MLEFSYWHKILLLLLVCQYIPLHLTAPVNEQDSLATSEFEDLEAELLPGGVAATKLDKDLKGSASIGHGAYSYPYYKPLAYPYPYYGGLSGVGGYGGYGGYGGVGYIGYSGYGGYGGLGGLSGYGLGYPYYGGYYSGHGHYPYGHYF